MEIHNVNSIGTLQQNGGEVTGGSGNVTAGWVLYQTIDATSEGIDTTSTWNSIKMKVEWHGRLEAENLTMQFNGDTGNNYFRSIISQNGSSLAASTATQSSMEIGYKSGGSIIESWHTTEFITNCSAPNLLTYVYGYGNWSRWYASDTDNALGTVGWRWNSGESPATVTSFVISSNGGECTGTLKIYRWVE